MKSKKRISLLAVLVCVFALVFSLGLMSACGNTDDTTASGNWFYGTEAPADGLGNNGDFYLNTETLTAYAKSEDGTWTQTTLYSGKGIPANDAGEAGDLYLDIENGILYQKGEDLWAVALTLQGEKGRDGILWFSGDTDPTSVPQGAMVGDFYLNNKEFTVWQLTAKGWVKLGTIKGDKGDDASQLYNGNGAPTAENPANPKEGDLYLGVFKGIDEDGAGYRLYRYQDGEWKILMDTVVKNTVEIHTLDELSAFSASVEKGNTYAGKEVHLKEDIHFETAEASSMRKNAPAREAEAEWKPIGSADHPFMGTFNGEGHTIYNFKANATANQKVGFFGAVKSATIEHLRFVEAEVTATGSNSFGAVVVGEVLKSDTSDYTSIIDVVVEASSVSATDESAKVGGLVGQVAGDTTVTVEDVDVSADGTDGSLVGSGEGQIEGKNIEVGEKVGEGFYKKNKLDESGEVDESSTSYEILNLAGLEYFRDSVNGTLEGKEANNYSGQTVTLGNDIDLSSVENWEPIGGQGKPFSGIFDGNNHVVTNLHIDGGFDNVAQNNYHSFFGLAGTLNGDVPNPTIKNFTLRNVDISGGLNVAAVIGHTAKGAMIENVTVEGNIQIKGAWYVGGIVGYGYNNVRNCKVIGEDGSVIAYNVQYAGGIAGWRGEGSSEISGCRVENITVRALNDSSCAGGITGIAQYNNKILNNELVNVILDLSAVVDASRVGAVAGCFSAKSSEEVATISGNRGNVKVIAPGAEYVNQGLVGHKHPETTVQNVTLENNTVTVVWNGAARDDANKAVHIYSAEGLKWLRDEINAWKPNGNQPFGSKSKSFAGWTAYLEADIDLNNEEWIPIGNVNTDGDVSFAGTFDGQGHKIQNLKISKGYDKGTGFFGRVIQSAVIRDIIFENAEISVSSVYTGVVVGRAGSEGNPSLQKITVQGMIHVSGTTYVGAVVGHMGAIADTITVNVKDGSYVRGSSAIGGIAGGTKQGVGVCTYSNLKTNIDVIATGSSGYVGGIVGWEQGGTYSNCTATGTLSAASGPVNACFGYVVNEGTTVDHFTYTGEITSGTVTGFYYKGADATFTNSTATVTHGGTTTVYTADASGNVTSGN